MSLERPETRPICDFCGHYIDEPTSVVLPVTRGVSPVSAQKSLETFLEHYRGDATPAAQRREREKVEWL